MVVSLKSTLKASQAIPRHRDFVFDFDQFDMADVLRYLSHKQVGLC